MHTLPLSNDGKSWKECMRSLRLPAEPTALTSYGAAVRRSFPALYKKDEKLVLPRGGVLSPKLLCCRPAEHLLMFLDYLWRESSLSQRQATIERMSLSGSTLCP